jgi:hypothetical protein
MPVKDTQYDIAFQNKEVEVFDINRAANPFEQNPVLSQALRRIERITLAVHLVTNAVPDTEQIKQQVRTDAQDVLRYLLAHAHGFYKKDSTAYVALHAKVRGVLALLDMVHIVGYLSLDHLELIKRAYVDMLTLLASGVVSGTAHTGVLTGEDLVSVHQSKGQLSTHKGHIKDIQQIKDTEEKNNQESKKRETPLAQKKATNNRRLAIIDVLTTRHHATLQDIATALPKVGLKTIQRELAKLVEDGVAIRKGERRWTTYSLNGA